MSSAEAWMYPGLFGIGLVIAGIDAFGVGANDVANAFANAVASRTLTLRQACLIALFSEFFGALLLGSSVTDTIRKKVIDVSLFESEPYMLMLGMVCSSVGSATWVLLATKLSMPVSTTHATLGAVMGVGIAAFGVDTVNWGWEGVGKIVASWFISPVLSGTIAAIVYLTIKFLVLKHENSFQRGLRFTPVFCFLVFGTIAAFVVFKGSPALKLDALPFSTTIPVVIAIAFFFGIVGLVCLSPWLERTLEGGENLPWFCIPVAKWLAPRPKVQQPVKEVELGQVADPQTTMPLPMPAALPTMPIANTGITKPPASEVPKPTRLLQFATKFLPGLVVDINDSDNSSELKHLQHAQVFSDKTERLYSFLQISTSTFVSFAHGANDVANACGPLAAVWAVYSTGAVPSKAPVPIWVLAFGGGMIDLGLIVYGHNIMRALGNKLTMQSPSRGLAMDVGTMLAVMIFSKLGVPISTTHAISGAIMGVGLCNGDAKAVNWRMVGTIFLGWLLTVPLAGLVAGGMFYMVAFAPNFSHYS
mmetsp:Transcript_2026/g.4666  ORF Transcript_2026/g.4666 Transcript_2026/m.4666 type:complete len:532 (-) Transcript_2026:46-1641(-)|eukprot:CAMPEP_0114551870 /NCGR_PEP_ID=MMETSP0114-20121206/6828_1 /TAXON_ID=31324 /ORGANISM="Goniomonas sp, Strain m" /LENGTH=531 /DNA_ID=CAMNT_0001736721 /DNA_START=93 /DNA_END=1688 /DNA_ORIENTATION=+